MASMDAMVLQAEPVPHGPAKEYGPWHFHDQRFLDDGRMDFSEAMPLLAGRPAGFLKRDPGLARAACLRTASDSEGGRQRPLPTAPKDSCHRYGTFRPATPAGTRTSRGFSVAANQATELPFTAAILPVQKGYDFSSIHSVTRPRLSVKRRRASSDVDGPYTESQRRKKRRLRKEMATSRLSQPFSEPATHIINREFVTKGGRYFLRLAAIVSARWMSNAASTPAHQTSHPSPCSLLRRAAVINRFRLGVRSRAMERGDNNVADQATIASLLQQDHGIGCVVGARSHVTTSSAPLLAGPRLHGRGETPQSAPPFQLSLAAEDARPRPKSPRLKAAEASRLRLRPSPRTRPLRSPEHRSTRYPYLDDLDNLDDDVGLDEEEVAFPTSEHESRYEATDEPDDVYADFGMIFGGGAIEDDTGGADDERCEDYMDEMDGIPWTVR